MTIDGNTYDPFSAETLKVLPSPHLSLKDSIIALNHKKYALPADEVKSLMKKEEMEILGREDGHIPGGGTEGEKEKPPPEPIL